MKLFIFVGGEGRKRKEERGMEFILFKARLVGRHFSFEENSHADICFNFEVLIKEIKDFTILYCTLPFFTVRNVLPYFFLIMLGMFTLEM